MKTRNAIDSFTEIATLRIELDGSDPLIWRVAQQTVDLLPVTRNHWYHRDQRGSWSIKAVLPTMTSLDYNSLDVKDGTDAQQAYLKAIRPETSDEERSVLSDGLKSYCAQDTWAMVAMARFLLAAA